MPRPRSYRSEAVVLKSTPIGEAGLIVTLYSRDAGKLRAVARGARKPSGKMVGHLEPLNVVELAVVRSRSGGLDTITQAQIVEMFTSLKANLEGVSRGIYVAELVDGFGAEGSPNGGLYSLLVDTLRFLDDPGNGELALRYFELQLLKCSGFMPELYRCVECRKELSPDNHLFSPEAGGTLCSECTPAGRIMRLSVQALKVMRFLDRALLPDTSRLQVTMGLATEVRGLLSAALKYWLDREIHSSTFLEHLKRPHTADPYVGSAPGLRRS